MDCQIDSNEALNMSSHDHGNCELCDQLEDDLRILQGSHDELVVMVEAMEKENKQMAEDLGLGVSADTLKRAEEIRIIRGPCTSCGAPSEIPCSCDY